MLRRSHARPGRAGSLLIVLAVMLLAGVGMVYLAQPAMAANPCSGDILSPPAPADGTTNGVGYSIWWTQRSGKWQRVDWAAPTNGSIHIYIDDYGDGIPGWADRGTHTAAGYYEIALTGPDWYIRQILICGTPRVDPMITVIKQIDRDANGTFESTAGAGEYGFSLDGGAAVPTNASGQVVFNVTGTGSHTITEVQLSSAQGTYLFKSGSGFNCKFNGSTATAEVRAGSPCDVLGRNACPTPPVDATCTFQNGGGGQIVVKKVTSNGDAVALFTFSRSWGADFTLTGGDSETSALLPAGVYSVAEVGLPAGWSLASSFCDDGSSPAAIGVSLGEVVTCTFNNRYEETTSTTEGTTTTTEGTSGPEGSLTIVKQTVPAGGAGFAFEAGALGTFSLDDGGSKTFTDLVAGAYTVTETPAADWGFASITCDALDYVVDGASVTVNLAEGEAAVCTFYNGELPYTGGPSLTMPLLLGGLAALLMGLALRVWSLMRQADRA